MRNKEILPRNAQGTGGQAEMRNLDPNPKIGHKGQQPDDMNIFEE